MESEGFSGPMCGRSAAHSFPLESTTEEIELRDRCGNCNELSLASEGNTEQQQETRFISLPEPHPQSCCGDHTCLSCAPENQPCPLCNEQETADSAREDILGGSWEVVELPAEADHACLSYAPENQPCPLCNRQETADSAHEDILGGSWEVVELPAEASEVREPMMCRGPSPAPKPAARSEHPSIPIRKVLMKQNKAMSPRFYTAIGYLMQIQFSCNSSKGHHSKVNVYIYTRPGKNDKALRWPLRGKVQILSINLGGDVYHTSEIPGTWERPGTYCKGELDIPYEELPEDKNGMLKFCVRVIPD